MPTLSQKRSSSSRGQVLRPVQLALTKYLPAAQVDALAQATGCPYRRRVFSPYQVLWAGVDQALGGQLSQGAVVSRLAAASGHALDRDSRALCRARQRCPASLARDALSATPASLRDAPGQRSRRGARSVG